jgi:UDP-N-acetylmuramate--alanine ligase
VNYFQDFDTLFAALPGTLQEGDVFLTLGAGNIWSVGQRWLDAQ